jgi:acetyltransferase-like isoleucine patch superfamily enzyme
MTDQHRRAQRTASYVREIVRGLHVRYALAYTLAHLFPAFTAGPIVARLYRVAGFRIGEGSTFLGPVCVRSTLAFQENLEIGRKVLISTDVTINVDGPVRIEDEASIGPFVAVYTGTHAVGPASRRMSPAPFGKPVTIERGAWVRLGAIILPGVTVGHGSVVGAGSVVMSDVEPNTYVEGNPARAAWSLPDSAPHCEPRDARRF